MAVILSLIGGITETGDSVSAGSASIFAAISIEGDNTDSQTRGTHTYGVTSFTNSPLIKTSVGSNFIYSDIGHIVSPASGPLTYISTLSSSPPSIGHSTLLLGIEGADGSDLIDGTQTENFANSGVNVFPTHTFSMVSGQAAIILVQANKAGDITPPADNGNDTWVELIEPWFIGGAFSDGAAFKLEATETHSNATATPGDDINDFIFSSHMYVFNEAAAGGETLTADSGSYTQTGTTTPIIAAFNVTSLSGSYTVTGTTTPLNAALNIISDTGSYTVTGTNLNLTPAFNVLAASGGYAVSGTNVDLRFGSILTAESGSYAVTGTLVNLVMAARMTTEAGSYIITGTDVTLTDSGNIWTDIPLPSTVWVDGILQSTAWADEPNATTIWTDL